MKTFSSLIFIVIFFMTSSFILQDTKEKIERDLKLSLSFNSNATIEEGFTCPQLKLTLTNTSTADKHKIISPGDGSEWGWREPYIYCTAYFDKGDGKWEKLNPKKPSRCGVYNPDWEEDVITLAPQKSTLIMYDQLYKIDQWFEIPSVKGTIKLAAHYDYKQGKNQKGGYTDAPKNIQGIPQFELISNTVEIPYKK